MRRAKGLLKPLPSRFFLVSKGMPRRLVFQGARLCRGNFFISKSWNGSFRRLKRFWARYPIFRAERANQQFSVSTGEGPSIVNKVLCGTPLPDSGSGLVLDASQGRD